MPNGVYAAMTGALAQEEYMDILSNNLANGSTVGFKATRATFEEVYGDAMGMKNETQRHVQLDSTYTDFSQGGLRQTHSGLDVAVMGEGFLVVQTPEGERYTRNGSFTLDAQRKLVNLSGFPVVGSSGEFEVPEGEVVAISQDGTVSAGEVQLGKLKVVKFDDPGALRRYGHGLWIPQGTDAATPQETFTVQPGWIEQSNVNMIHEMTELIKVTRFYEAFHKTIQTFRTVDSTTARDLGR